MGMYRVDEVLGRMVNGKVVCAECCSGEEWEAMKELDAITGSDSTEADFIYFCDRCKRKL